MQKIIVISAVNLVEGGTLSILSQCLCFLDKYIRIAPMYKVIVLIHDKRLCYYENPMIEYIEYKFIKRNWIKRIKFEYSDCKQLSKRLSPFLWISLHDITPNVSSIRQVVYCHNPAPFRKLTLRDLKFNYKLFLFTCLYKYLYRINIHKNDFIIVQQNWLREAFSTLYHIDKKKIIVAYPKESYIENVTISTPKENTDFLFFYPSIPRPFKNFEVICEAVILLDKRGISNFKVQLTLDGSENTYSKWLFEKYGTTKGIIFSGLLTLNEVKQIYRQTDCLIFPSTLETWGLPISEFAIYNKSILAANLPYAHETASGVSSICFFDPTNANELADRMEDCIRGDFSCFAKCDQKEVQDPFANSWEELFNIILKE